MRTTLNLDEDVLDAAKAIATAERRSLGQVVSRLARRGLTRNLRATTAGWPTFTVPADAAPLTDEIVRRGLDED